MATLLELQAQLMREPAPALAPAPQKQTLPLGVGPRQGLPAELEGVEKFFVAFSGGKDSVACVLHLLDIGIPRDRIELWHYMMDPPDKPLMDWPITEDYCRQFAKALGLVILFSGKVGGFEKEMMRENAPAGAVFYATLNEAGKPVRRVLEPADRVRVTKLAFPPPVGDMQRRWCSAALKMEVGDRIIRNDPRLQAGTWCVVTGIRASESDARAKQDPLVQETVRRGTSRERTVWTWLAVHDWPEADVWAILEKHRVNPHPAYKIGFGRVSCMTCIFGNREQWATVKAIAPERFDTIADYEDYFGKMDPARRVDRVSKETGEPIPHAGAISILDVNESEKTGLPPKYRKIRELVRGNYMAIRPVGPLGKGTGKEVNVLASYTEAAAEVLKNLANAVVQASTREERRTILSAAVTDLAGIEAAASLPGKFIKQMKAQVVAAGGDVAANVKGYFDAVDTVREQGIFVPPAESFVPSGMDREVKLSQASRYTDAILLPPGKWKRPAGAFKRDGGPI